MRGLIQQLLLNFIVLNFDNLGVEASSSVWTQLHLNLKWKVEYGDDECAKENYGKSFFEATTNDDSGYVEANSNDQKVYWVEFGLQPSTMVSADWCTTIDRTYIDTFDTTAQRDWPEFRRD